MIKIICEQKSYDESPVGKQPYDARAEININEDASITDVMQGVIAMLKIAGYYIDENVLVNAVKDAAIEELY